MADPYEVDLDSIVGRLSEVRASRPGKQVQLLEAEIRYLCTNAREIFMSQPILLELEAPIKVCNNSPPVPSPFLSFSSKDFAAAAVSTTSGKNLHR
jgi:hypothetical protein